MSVSIKYILNQPHTAMMPVLPAADRAPAPSGSAVCGAKVLRQVGRNHAAPDALRKVSGELVYGSDMVLPGMLHARLLLSPHAHARVLGVDAQRALASPGVLAVYWHGNTPSKPYCRYRILPEQQGCVDDEPLFAPTVRCAGDRVAVVVASTAAQAARATALLDVDYEALPAALDAASALAPGAPPIHPGGNLLHAYDHAAGTPVQGDCAQQHSVCTSVDTQMLHHAAIEPHLCIGQCDAAGKITLWSPSQSVYGARTVVADWLGLPYGQVRVIKIPTGGSFGGKQEFILEPLTAYLARQLRRPVHLLLERDACLRGTMVRPMQTSTLRSTLDAQGRLLDLQVDTVLAAGPYASSSPDYTEAMAHKLTRLYRMGHYRHRARVAYTNTPVAGGMRGWGAPDIATCAEIHLDQVARALGRDPVALREALLVHPHQIDPMGGQSLGDARVLDALRQGALRFGWSARAGRDAGTGRWRKAVGMACGAHKNGMLSAAFPETTTMTLRMNEDGSLMLNASVHEMGAGALTLMRVLCAEVLGLAPERVTVTEADSELTPFDFGCYGSRMTYVCGAAAVEVAGRLAQLLCSEAGALLGLPVEALELADGMVRERGGPASLAYEQIVRQARMRHARDIIVTHTYRGRSNPGSYSVQFAEVEVDTLTGRVLVTDFLCAVDIGRAINPQMVEGQCRGAVQAGIGSALCEQIVLDAQGRVQTKGLRDYHLINSVEMPRVDVLLITHEADDGPFGAKSVGEVAAVPTAAAVVNAVNRALGTAITTLPLTPERVVASLQTAPAPAPQEEAACC